MNTPNTVSYKLDLTDEAFAVIQHYAKRFAYSPDLALELILRTVADLHTNKTEGDE